MVKKTKTRKTAPRAAPARRIYRRRAKTGYDKIAPAMATAALVAVNAGNVKKIWNEATYNTGMDVSKIVKRIKTDNGTHRAMRNIVSGDALIADAAAIAGGYIGGEVVRKYAPTVIKRPIAKLAKKIPKVI